MSQWKIRVGSVWFLFLSLFAYPSPVLACSCSESGSPAAEFARADAVTRSWKGISTSTTEVTTGYGNGDCGYPFKVGETYVVYAYGTPNDLNAFICTRTVEVSRAVEDLRYLDTFQPLIVVSATQLPWSQAVIISLIVAGIWLFLARGWLFRRQRRGQL